MIPSTSLRTARVTPAVIILIALAVGACAAAPGATMSPPATIGVPAPTEVPMGTTDPSLSLPSDPGLPSSRDLDPDGIVPPAVLDAVLADAATRAGASVADVVVILASAVTWPNGALGCPQPGMMYTEALVPGYHVVVEAAGMHLDYRFGRNGPPRLCENPSPER